MFLFLYSGTHALNHLVVHGAFFFFFFFFCSTKNLQQKRVFLFLYSGTRAMNHLVIPGAFLFFFLPNKESVTETSVSFSGSFPLQFQ